MLNNLERTTVLFLAFLFLTTTPAISQSNLPGEVLTLDHAISIAVENSRLMEISALEGKKLEDRIAATLTKKRPTSKFSFFGGQLLTDINFNFQQGQFGQFPSTGPVPPQDTDVKTTRRPIGFLTGEIDQPLSQLRRINLAVLMQRLELDLNQEKIRQQLLDLTHQVGQTYYQIQEKESALDASEDIVKQYQELDRITSVYLSQETVLKSDALEVKSLLAQEDYKRLTLRHEAENQKEALNQLMARDIRTPFRTEQVPDQTPLELDLAAAQGLALSQRSEIKQAEIRIQQAEYDRRLKKSENTPDISLSFRYFSTMNIQSLPRNVAAVGVGFSWEPWDWGRKKDELSEKDRNVEQAKRMLEETQSQILLEVNQRHRKVAETRALLQMTRVMQEAAREKLSLYREKYAAQTILLKDLLQMQSSAAEVNQRYQQALLSFWAAKADFEKSLGTGR
jgi:outer membrane protein TolC